MCNLVVRVPIGNKITAHVDFKQFATRLRIFWKEAEKAGNTYG